MKKKENERLLESIEYIDENIVNAVMAKIDPKAPIVNDKIRVRNRALKIAVSIAACLVLLAVAIPTATVVMKLHENVPSQISVVIDSGVNTPPTVGADDTKIEVQTPPEHDGSKGLIYEINEDGKSATWTSFGTCTDEIVYIASTYDGVPVIAMINGPDADERKENGKYDTDEVMTKFGGKKVKKLIISDTVETVDPTIIRYCPNLESVYFGAKVNKIWTWLLSNGQGEHISELQVSPENAKYMSSGNCIIEKATNTLVRGCKTSIIPADGSVETIGANAFDGVTDLKTIAIPDCVKFISLYAFSNCEDLESIVLPAGLEKMDFGAFEFCQKLVSVDLNGLTVIPEMAFYSCKSLKEVNGIENVTEIGDNAFAFCRSLENFTLGKGLKKIGSYALSVTVYSINYEGTIEEWKAVEKGDIWNGFSTISYLEKVICSDGVSSESSMTQQEYRDSKNN